jgi:ribosomal protein L22
MNADTPEVPPEETPQEGEAPAAAEGAAKPRRKRAKAARTKATPAEAPAGVKADGPDADAEKAPARKPAAKKATAKKPAAAKKAVAVEDKEAKPATAPRRAKAAPKAPRRRFVRAHARYVRTSARKARMVCGHLRGKSVQEARAILAFTPREVARDWSKLLESAVANAESNHELLEDDLIVREAYADEGPTIKRFRPRAMGRATPIRKRTSHLTITLSPRPEPGTTDRHR